MYKLLYKLQYTKHKPAAATRLLYAAAVHKRERLRKKYITRRSWSVRTSTSRRSGPSTSLARKAGLLEDTWLCWTASLDSPPGDEQKKDNNKLNVSQKLYYMYMYMFTYNNRGLLRETLCSSTCSTYVAPTHNTTMYRFKLSARTSPKSGSRR